MLWVNPDLISYKDLATALKPSICIFGLSKALYQLSCCKESSPLKGVIAWITLGFMNTDLCIHTVAEHKSTLKLEGYTATRLGQAALDAPFQNTENTAQVFL